MASQTIVTGSEPRLPFVSDFHTYFSSRYGTIVPCSPCSPISCSAGSSLASAPRVCCPSPPRSPLYNPCPRRSPDRPHHLPALRSRRQLRRHPERRLRRSSSNPPAAQSASPDTASSTPAPPERPSPRTIAITGSPTLQPGQFYLLSAVPAGTGSSFTADQTSASVAFGAAAGRVYLSSSTTTITSPGCAPFTNSAILDSIPYGTTTSCTNAAPAPSTTKSDVRVNTCNITGNPATDYAATTVTTSSPRNSMTTLAPCSSTGGSTTIGVSGLANPSQPSTPAPPPSSPPPSPRQPVEQPQESQSPSISARSVVPTPKSSMTTARTAT